MNGYHSKGGLYFGRQEDGSVRVSHWLQGTANAGRADQAAVDVLDRSWSLTASEWASVIASVCARGESGETHTEATLFHEKSGAA